MGDRNAPEGKKVQGGYQPKPIQKGYSPGGTGDKPQPKPPTGGSGVKNPKSD